MTAFFGLKRPLFTFCNFQEKSFLDESRLHEGSFQDPPSQGIGIL